MYSIHF